MPKLSNYLYISNDLNSANSFVIVEVLPTQPLGGFVIFPLKTTSGWM